MRLHFSLGRYGQLVADGNVAAQFGVLNVADVNGIAALLNGRVRFQAPDLLAAVTRPVAGTDPSSHLDPIGAAGVHRNRARTGVDVDIHRPAHLQAALK